MVTFTKIVPASPDSTFTLYNGFNYTVPENTLVIIQGESQYTGYSTSGPYAYNLTITEVSPDIPSTSWAAISVPEGDTISEYTQYIGNYNFFNPATYSREVRAGLQINGSPSYYFRKGFSIQKSLFGDAFINWTRSSFCVFEVYEL